MDSEKKSNRFVFGPVPSRRLGRSLGVDLVPFKVCTYNCIYCQLGPTTTKTIERDDYVPVDEVLAQLDRKLRSDTAIDYITMSGSGEPTLDLSIARVIRHVKEITAIPVAVLTNGSLLHDQRVRSDCADADVVIPTLAAPDEELYQRIHRPAQGLTLESLVGSLELFRRDYQGQIWLEVFLLDGINDAEEHVRRIAQHAARIRPDRIQLNTAVRPTAETEARAVPRRRLESFCDAFRPRAEVIAEFSAIHDDQAQQVRREDVVTLLSRRPCTIEDIAAGLGIHRNEALKYVGELLQDGKVRKVIREGAAYFSMV